MTIRAVDQNTRLQVKDLIRRTIEFKMEVILHCTPLSRKLNEHPLETICEAYCKFASQRSDTILNLLYRHGVVVEGLILLRSVLDAAVKNWSICLANAEDRTRIHDDYSITIWAEHRRKINKYLELGVSVSGEDSAARSFIQTMTQPSSFGGLELSRRKAEEVRKKFAFGALVEQVEKWAGHKGIEVDFTLLKLMYDYCSDLSHANATGLLIDSELQERVPEEWSIAHIGNAASICGVIILCWYYMALFRTPERKENHDLYAQAKELLQISTRLSRKNWPSAL
jgi:hypothetical protein